MSVLVFHFKKQAKNINKDGKKKITIDEAPIDR